ncbi:MAG: NAD(P)H-dependent oxidoreductase subunit E [Dehalococcoidia bacterium]|nr:MAG: NAD(P)H-dependent oxidoreductase subunit E [Dehalococcoidia bacterium]
MESTRKENGGNLLSILQDTQKEYGYLPEDKLREIAVKLGMTLIDVYGVATFYRSFSLTPRGRHHIKVCLGTACHVRSSGRVLETAVRKLEIQPGETSKNGEYSLETVMCLGCCAIGPVMVADNKYYGQMSPAKTESVLKRLGEKQCLSKEK